mgnify:CR=1 FL=1
MIKIIYGEKGMGKTRILVDAANKLASDSSGNVVFIDYSNQLMHELRREIRFINTSDYPLKEPCGFLGFICGIIAQDYDIEGIFIDGLTYILNLKANFLEDFFSDLEEISNRFNVDFHMSVNGSIDEMPDYIKKYI